MGARARDVPVRLRPTGGPLQRLSPGAGTERRGDDCGLRHRRTGPAPSGPLAPRRLPARGPRPPPNAQRPAGVCHRHRSRDGRDRRCRASVAGDDQEPRTRGRSACVVRLLYCGLDGGPVDGMGSSARQPPAASLVRPGRTGARGREPRLRRLVRPRSPRPRAVCLLVRYVGRDVPTVAPHGSWSSPITLDLVASEGSAFYSYLSVSDDAGRVSAGGGLIVPVRGPHGGGGPRTELVVLPAVGSAEPRVIATGRDFYAAPRPSPDETRLAWLAWDHPHMPFEGTDLCIGELAGDGSCSNARRVAGSATESIFQPEWGGDGGLYFVSDRSGWSNLYVDRDGEVRALTQERADLGYPQWVFDLTRYAFLPDRRIACTFTRAAVDGLELLDVKNGMLERVDLPYTSLSGLRSHGADVVFAAS